MADSSLSIIVTGLIAQHPRLGGISWHYLQYLLGLSRLGHDVYYFEDSGQWPYNFDGGATGDDWISYDCSENVGYLDSLMRRFGLENRWSYRFPIRDQWFGLSASERSEVVNRAHLLLNVSGSLEFPDHYRQVRKLVYIDTDPVFTQVKLAREEKDFGRRVDAHDVHFSYGECLSSDPNLRTGHNWQPTRQPIVLSEWNSSHPPQGVFTTVMSWTSYKPLTYGGKTYGQKDLEFYRFLDLPKTVRPVTLELSLSNVEHVNWRTQTEKMPPEILELIQGKSDWSSRELLTRAGWNVVDAKLTCGDLDSYRNYVQRSKAEWSVAKNGYVQGGCGWFSERSACYLASGRPVVVQDTGFSKVLPVGTGIFAFKTMEEAAAAIERVEANYSQEAEAARAIAEGYFASDTVLTRLIEEALTGEANRRAHVQDYIR